MCWGEMIKAVGSIVSAPIEASGVRAASRARRGVVRGYSLGTIKRTKREMGRVLADIEGAMKLDAGPHERERAAALAEITGGGAPANATPIPSAKPEISREAGRQLAIALHSGKNKAQLLAKIGADTDLNYARGRRFSDSLRGSREFGRQMKAFADLLGLQLNSASQKGLGRRNAAALIRGITGAGGDLYSEYQDGQQGSGGGEESISDSFGTDYSTPPNFSGGD